MGYVVDVVDTTDLRLAKDEIGELRRKEADTTVVLVPPIRNGLNFVVDQVLKKTKDRQINVLRIWGHGYHGIQNVGAGQYFDGWEFGGAIDIRHFDVAGAVLANLRPRFYSRKSRIELRGCEVADGDEGKELLTRVAQTVGVRVMAATKHQSGMGWSGALYQADPDGGCKQIFYAAYDIWK